MFLISKFEKLLWDLNSVLILRARGGLFDLSGGVEVEDLRKNSWKAFTVQKNHATRMAIKMYAQL